MEEVEKFRDWLTASGAVGMSPVNPDEVIRVVTRYGILIAWQRSDDTIDYCPELAVLRAMWKKGRGHNITPVPGTKRLERRDLLACLPKLVQRDGPSCWFCDKPFFDASEATLEHLVPASLGGPDHVANLVLACEPCNNRVSNLSVAEKVKYRDARRGYVVRSEDETRQGQEDLEAVAGQSAALG